jgi:hypothetical protein
MITFMSSQRGDFDHHKDMKIDAIVQLGSPGAQRRS